MKTVEVWKAKSFWEEQHADGSKTYWHLHPELVEEDVKKQGHSTLLCSRCAESIKKQKIPKFSIADHIDFGWSQRLGLTPPNITEQLILAQTRLYYTCIKICSNKSGLAQDYDLWSMARIHAILFPHDAPDVVGRRLRGANLFHAGGLLDDKKI